MLVNKSQLPCPEPEFRAKLAEYLAAREAHSRTIDVPAPFPEFEIFRTIAEQGGDLIVVDNEDDGPPVADNLPEPVKTILSIERVNPITHRALREFFIGFGDQFPQFKETRLYQRCKEVDDLIRVERAKL
jgi:hypothetical protein